MSWLKNIIRPKIATTQKRDMPSHIWEKCPGCGDMLYGKDHEQSLKLFADHHKATQVEQDFRYSSDKNTDWLTVSEIRSLIKEHVDPDFDAS